MISYDTDPSLYTAEPEPPRLGDGFSRPQHGDDAVPADADPRPGTGLPSPLGDISPF